MKYTIDTDACQKEGLDLAVILAGMIVLSDVDLNELKIKVFEEGILVEKEGEVLITATGRDRIHRVLLSSDKSLPSEDRIESLAIKLMDIFPKGKKEGTSVYWKGNKKDNKLRLQKFFKLYGNTYTDEQIIAAAQSYVDSFNGTYTYMRALKYFIWKDERKLDSSGNMYIEEVSDLATYIENEGQEGGGAEQNWEISLR